MVSEDIWLYKKNLQIKNGFGGFIIGELVDLYRIENLGWIVKSISDSLQVFVSDSETDELLGNLKVATKIKRTRIKRPWRLTKC